jgi:hypothetical protein
MKKCFFKKDNRPSTPWIDGYFHGIFMEGSMQDGIQTFAVVSPKETEDANDVSGMQKIHDLRRISLNNVTKSSI